jgi:hypothetical protein
MALRNFVALKIEDDDDLTCGALYKCLCRRVKSERENFAVLIIYICRCIPTYDTEDVKLF